MDRNLKIRLIVYKILSNVEFSEENIGINLTREVFFEMATKGRTIEPLDFFVVSKLGDIGNFDEPYLRF